MTSRGSDMPEIVEVNDSTLLGIADPEQALVAAERFAAALKARIDAGGLAHRISGKDYLGIEALQMAATALGIVGVVVETHQLEDGGWMARAEARVIGTGQVVGAGVSVCGVDEPRWARSASYARLGMAETRALARALRGPVGSVVSLASYAVTPAEEMDSSHEADPLPAPEWPDWARAADKDQRRRAAEAVAELLEAATGGRPTEKEVNSIGRAVRERCGGMMPVCVAMVLVDVAATAVITNKTEVAS